MILPAKSPNWSRILLAGLLVFSLLAASSIPRLCCPEQAGVSETAAVQLAKAADQASDCDYVCVGANCACHHGVGFAKLADRLTFQATFQPSRSVRAAYDKLPSAPPVELLRPPRA